MIKSNYLVMDVETGGLCPDQNPITQFACVVLDSENLRELGRWETFVKPYNGLTIEKAALDGTMVRMSDINKGRPVEEFIALTTEFFSQYIPGNTSSSRLTLVGHNVAFDAAFMNYALRYVGNVNPLTRWVHEAVIDTMLLSKLMWGGEESLRLGVCCERARIRLTDAHGAMADTEATASLLRYFMRRLRNSTDAGAEEATALSGQDFFRFRCAAGGTER